MNKIIKIGTRGSKLALWQANHLKDELAAKGREATLVIIKTQGDKIQDLPLNKLEGKGFFTKEIEEQLLSSEVDIAVHSLKDLPTEGVEDLILAGVSYREDPADWLIINKSSYDAELPMRIKKDAIVGTSSIRRKTQLLHFRNDLTTKDIRGNVPTRIKKLAEGMFDGIVLAAAGIKRLEIDLSAFEVTKFNPKEFIPAPAQGVVAYQVRKQDVEMRRLLKHIHHSDVSACSNVERRVLQLLAGGCHTPLGVFCEKDASGNFHAYSSYAAEENKPLVFSRLSYSTNHNLAEDLFAKLKK